MTHLLKRDDGKTETIITTDGLPQGCPSAPLAFSMLMKDTEEQFCRHIAGDPHVVIHGGRGVHIRRYMGDISLIVAPEIADQCFEYLCKALTEGGMKLNQDKCTAWVSNGEIPETPITRNLWNQAKDHRVLIVCGFPATYDDPAKEASIAYPIGSEEFVQSFLEARKKASKKS
jgi:hypothetical protein